MRVFALYAGAAFCEIAGCYAYWVALRQQGQWLWLAAGTALLMAFAVLLAFIPAAYAGRAFAAYGGVYVAASLVWMATVEGGRPDGADLAGAALVLAGAGIILLWPR